MVVTIVRRIAGLRVIGTQVVGRILTLRKIFRFAMFVQIIFVALTGTVLSLACVICIILNANNIDITKSNR